MNYRNFPLVSIILPVFNGEKYLGSAIESVLSQHFSNFELIIVNDASTDGTEKIINTYAQKDKRIRVINNPENIKLPASLNIGHEAAVGRFMTWTSDDNILERDFLSRMIETIQDQKVDIVFSDFKLIDKGGDIIGERHTGPVEHLIFGNTIGASFLYKKEVFETLKGFNTDLFLVEDFDFWLRASLHFKFYHLKRYLYRYRLHPQSLTTDIHGEKKKIFKEKVFKMYSFFKKNLGFSEITIRILSNIHLKEPIILNEYINNSNIIKKDLGLYAEQGGFNRSMLYSKLINTIQMAWLKNSENHSMHNLLQVFFKTPNLFFTNNNWKFIAKIILKSLIEKYYSS